MSEPKHWNIKGFNAMKLVSPAKYLWNLNFMSNASNKNVCFVFLTMRIFPSLWSCEEKKTRRKTTPKRLDWTCECEDMVCYLMKTYIMRERIHLHLLLKVLSINQVQSCLYLQPWSDSIRILSFKWEQTMMETQEQAHACSCYVWGVFFGTIRYNSDILPLAEVKIVPLFHSEELNLLLISL